MNDERMLIDNLFIGWRVYSINCSVSVCFFKVDGSFHGRTSSFNTTKNTIFECHKKSDSVFSCSIKIIDGAQAFTQI